mmetsp:Transcript_21885/g.56295  ORF Transcript_21885/g.56295 Transcript_21885/m.56295 type:complete len:210 (-) Transcript_21885:39-668(-)
MGFESAAILAPVATASSTRLSAGTTRLASPRAHASSAPMCSPVSTSSMARDLPSARVNRCVPPRPGIVPSLISGWPKVAFSPAMMKSHAIANSQPPPSAKPFTAAIIGNRASRKLSSSLNIPCEYMSMYDLEAISSMSAPAAKNFLLPVMTSAPSSGSASAAATQCPISATSLDESAFTLGRLRVMRPTAPRFSKRMVSNEAGITAAAL